MNHVCEQIRERIDDALDARLKPAEQAEFDAHVRACGSCAAEWDLASSLRASLLRIGLPPAPEGLRESIGAEVRRAAAAGRAARSAPPLPARRAGRAWMRAAAGVLAIVTIGWVGWRASIRGPSGTQPPRGEAMEPRPLPKVAEARPAKDDRAPVEVQVVWNHEPALPPAGRVPLDARATTALSNAQEVATGGPEAVAHLNRIVTAGASPDDRRRQAEVLMLLRDNMPALADAAGEAPALSDLGRDADDTLEVFSEPAGGKAAVRGAPAGAPRPAAREEGLAKEKSEAPPESALKVQPSSDSDALAPAGRAGYGARLADGGSTGPAFYMVSGPGAIGRVERFLSDQKLRFHQVRLTEPAASDRRRKLEDRDAAYKIVEVEVPEGALDATIGELESLVGLRLAPVGVVLEEPAPAQKRLASRGGRGAGAPRRDAAPESRPQAPASPNPLSFSKLRLVLIAE